MGYITSMFLNIHFCIQCGTTYTWHITISASITRLSTIYAWQQNPYRLLPAPTHPALTGFSSLTGFGYEFMFSPISQHGYKMGNMDIHTCLEHIPKLILNAENYFIPYWDLPCYNNCLWNLMEQPNYPVMEMWILTYCWKMQYNIFLGARKKNDSLWGWGCDGDTQTCLGRGWDSISHSHWVWVG